MLAQNSATQLIGIGARDAADNLHVRWPSGIEQAFYAIPAAR